MNDQDAVSLLTEIRNWVRATSYSTVKSLLSSALADGQLRRAYQMLDGTASMDQVRTSCRMSPNKLQALTQKWTSMGIMEAVDDKKRKRLFDLRDFDLLPIEE